MGICNAPELFHQLMVDMLDGIPGVEVYIDDILINASTVSEHDARLEQVLQIFMELGVTLNREKCIFAQGKIAFLGHELSAERVRPSYSKVQTVQNMVVPHDKKAVERLLGFVTYLAKFLPNLSEVTQPLREMCKKGIQFHWGKEQDMAVIFDC